MEWKPNDERTARNRRCRAQKRVVNFSVAAYLESQQTCAILCAFESIQNPREKKNQKVADDALTSAVSTNCKLRLKFNTTPESL